MDFETRQPNWKMKSDYHKEETEGKLHDTGCDKQIDQNSIRAPIPTPYYIEGHNHNPPRLELQYLSTIIKLVTFLTLIIAPITKLSSAQAIISHQLRRTTRSSGPSYKCQPTGSFFCNIDNYNTIQPFSNELGHQTLDAARADLHRYAILDSLEIPNPILKPCRETCEEAMTVIPSGLEIVNMTVPAEWDCGQFPSRNSDPLCVINHDISSGYESNNNPDAIDPLVQHQNSQHHPKVNFMNHQEPKLPGSNVAPPKTSGFSDLIASDQSSDLCGPNMFDCRSGDPKHAVCIELKLVCDGKNDCNTNSSSSSLVSYSSIDEANCQTEPTCLEGFMHCDGRCIDTVSICDGKVDCPSGADEQICRAPIDVTSLIQVLLCLLIIFACAILSLRFLCSTNHLDSDLETSNNTLNRDPNSSIVNHHQDIDDILHLNHPVVSSHNNIITEHHQDQSIFQSHQHHHLNNNLSHMNGSFPTFGGSRFKNNLVEHGSSGGCHTLDPSLMKSPRLINDHVHLMSTAAAAAGIAPGAETKSPNLAGVLIDCEVPHRLPPPPPPFRTHSPLHYQSPAPSKSLQSPASQQIYQALSATESLAYESLIPGANSICASLCDTYSANASLYNVAPSHFERTKPPGPTPPPPPPTPDVAPR